MRGKIETPLGFGEKVETRPGPLELKEALGQGYLFHVSTLLPNPGRYNRFLLVPGPPDETGFGVQMTRRPVLEYAALVREERKGRKIDKKAIGEISIFLLPSGPESYELGAKKIGRVLRGEPVTVTKGRAILLEGLRMHRLPLESDDKEVGAVDLLRLQDSEILDLANLKKHLPSLKSVWFYWAKDYRFVPITPQEAEAIRETYGNPEDREELIEVLVSERSEG